MKTEQPNQDALSPVRTTYEAVLIWSAVMKSNDPSPERVHKAFNRCFDAEPTMEELATMVAEKHAENEALPLVTDPAMHGLSVRTVLTQDIDLGSLVNDYNDKHYPEDDADVEG